MFLVVSWLRTLIDQNVYICQVIQATSYISRCVYCFIEAIWVGCSPFNKSPMATSNSTSKLPIEVPGWQFFYFWDPWSHSLGSLCHVIIRLLGIVQWNITMEEELQPLNGRPIPDTSICSPTVGGGSYQPQVGLHSIMIVFCLGFLLSLSYPRSYSGEM